VAGIALESFRDRVAVVTGAASGIGRALAIGLAGEGARVVLADVDEPGLSETAAGVEGQGAEALPVRTDVTELGQVQALAEQAWARFGGVHVLCNNAGVVVHGGLEAATREDWQWVLGVNLWGVIHGLLAFLPRLIAQGQGGYVVNTASMAGLVATQGLGVYNTAKYAVVGLSETLAKDLRPYGIGVSVVCPMAVATGIREADRNRPAALRNPPGAGPAPEVRLMGRTLSPEAVAAQTLAAVRRGALYVITHEEALPAVRRRFERIAEAAREGSDADVVV
jgi:NAD(P)-dependent dehydrogenase (short-subunit alcohol dehydrogenase family)